MDRGLAQASAPTMRVSELAPKAPIELRNLHPRARNWAFALPDEVPRMGLKLPDAAQISLTPKIRALSLEPDRDRVCITWVGEHCEPVPVGPGKFAKTTHGVHW
jgi:hypothetical protein